MATHHDTDLGSAHFASADAPRTCEAAQPVPTQLRQEWELAAAAVCSARHHSATAARFAFSLYPHVTAEIADPRYPDVPMSRQDIERGWQSAEVRKQLLAVRDRWTAEVAAIDRTHEVEKLEDATLAAELNLRAAGAQLVAIRPAGIQELAWKLEAIIGLPYDDQEANLDLSAARTILDDLKRMIIET